MWGHRPTPEEILAARLDRGWKPTPSVLTDGAKVLGFAKSVDPSDWNAPKS
ncbi:MAG: hypothetical protein AAF533_28455 [Acidobacteriota bacterium]